MNFQTAFGSSLRDFVYWFGIFFYQKVVPTGQNQFYMLLPLMQSQTKGFVQQQRGFVFYVLGFGHNHIFLKYPNSVSITNRLSKNKLLISQLVSGISVQE